MTPELEIIVNEVCAYFGVKLEDINVKSQKREIAERRQWVMYMCKKHTKASHAVIAGIFGKDHATCIFSCNTINNLIDTDSYKRDIFKEIDQKVKERLKSYRKMVNSVPAPPPTLAERVASLEIDCAALEDRIKKLEGVGV